MWQIKNSTFNAASQRYRMARLPFSVFQRKGRRFFYVQFKSKNGNYLPAISTKQTVEELAIETAFKWYWGGLPADGGETINLSLRDVVNNVKSKAEADFICNELKRIGFIKNYIVAESKQDVDFPSFLKNFWDFDNSPYIKEKLRKKHGIHRKHTVGQENIVKKYWMPYFEGRLLGDITQQDIEVFMDNLDIISEQNYLALLATQKRKISALSLQQKREISCDRKNKIVKAGTTPLRWAYAKGFIEKDVTKGIIWFSGESKKRQILTPEIAQAIFQVEWLDKRLLLANLLSAVTGLRSGEIRALRIQDLGNDCLYIRHSYNDYDKLKPTKNNKIRTVEVPFSFIINELIYLAKENPHGTSMDSFIFWADKSESKPIESCLFVKGLRDALIKIGLSKETAAGYDFHGWRHFFTTYMISRLEKKLLKKQTGHLTDKMVDMYGDHFLVEDREKIRQAQQQVFGSLVPRENMAIENEILDELKKDFNDSLT